jgi:competence protein ComEC
MNFERYNETIRNYLLTLFLRFEKGDDFLQLKSPVTYLVILEHMLYYMRKYLLIAFFLASLLSVAACLSSIPSLNTSVIVPPPPENLTVHFINVWVGESILIQSPSGKTMLINAGDEDHGKVVSSYLKNLSINSLDVVVASDPDDTKIGGMTTILQDINVKEFIDSGYSSDSRPHNTYTNMRSLVEEKKIPFRTVKAGDMIALDPAVTVNVLNPQSQFSKTANENSVVLKIIYGNTSFLFMGNVNTERENTIAEAAGHSDILKVGYYGHSSEPAFLSLIKPGVSIIAAGYMPQYNIPDVDTIQRLRQSGSAVYITYLNGTVRVTTDGKTYSVTSEK